MFLDNKLRSARGFFIGSLLAITACAVVDSRKEKVVVIGAGLAGLNTALLLEENGFDVTVLEARQRIGGRLYTLDDVPGKPEAGGNTIGPNYARVIDRATELGLELVRAPDVIGGMRTMQMYVDGQFINPAEWAASPANPFPERLKAVPPGSMMFAALRKNPLTEPADWTLPAYAKYDVAAATVFDAMGLDARGKRLINHSNSYGSTLDNTSLLQLYRIGASYAKARQLKGHQMAVAGGNQRLPEAMANAVKGKVLTGKEVTRIHQDKTGVAIRTKDGSDYQADYVVAAIPLTALRNVDVVPALPAIQQRAVNEIEYAKTLIAQLTVSAPYWGEQTPSLWTDTAIERIFATSLDGSGQVSNVTFWLTGDNAMQFSAMAADQRDAALLEAFYKIFPRAEGKVALQKVIDWNQDPYAQGTWPSYKPGQITALVPPMSKPLGRLYFAGEHTAISNGGMEAAMESGERAVAEILRGRASASQLFGACKACHAMGEDQPHKLGPNLQGVFGRSAASRSDYVYSEALKNAELNWDKSTLTKWLQAPEKLVPGTKMLYRSPLNKEEIEQLVDYLLANKKE